MIHVKPPYIIRDESPWWAAGFTREWWLALSGEEREDFLADLSDAELEEFFTDWRVWARDKQLPPPWSWRTWLLCCGRGFGKALALDTPIPTPTGWTTMGEIQTGDMVLDEHGNPCRVVRAHEVLHHRVCYRVEFNDGSSIVADAEHLWNTETAVDRKAARRGHPRAMQTRTTEQIRATLMHGKDRNHSIPVTDPIVLPPANLPIDPYLLGCWLGDGTSACGEITTADPQIVEAFRSAGYPIGKPRPAGGASMTFPITNGYVGSVDGKAKTFTGQLRALGVLDDKHVPPVYLRGSAQQRQALLQGLMDTDGSAGPSHVEFCTTKAVLADAVFELATSLGMIPRRYDDRARLNGQDCGPRHRISFRPRLLVFRLERKAAITPIPAAQADRTRRRYIVAVTPADSVPVRCITVDSPSALYLAGREMIPTHNTRTAVEYILEEVERGFVKRIAIVGQGLDDIRTVMVEGDSGFLACAKPHNKPKFYPSVGGGRLEWPNGAVAFLYSAEDTEALRGPQFHLAWFDEPMAVPPEKRERALANLRFGLRLKVPGSRPRLILSTTPKKHAWMRQMLLDAQEDAKLNAAGKPTKKRIALTMGSTYENEDNLAEDFLDMILEDYEGTRLGKQEIYGQLIGDDENALWTRELLDRQRFKCLETDDGSWPSQLLAPFAKSLDKVLISVDPNIKANTKGGAKAAHAAGISVVGKKGKDRFVIEDRSTSGGPRVWGMKAVQAAIDYGATEIVAEVNQGGEMVKMVIEQAFEELDFRCRVVMVRATKGKQRRAEPVAAQYERGRVFHLGHYGSTREPGPFYKLEEQMTSLHEAFDPTGEDFDRIDAVVWGLTRLKVGRGSSARGTSGSVGIHTFKDFR